MKRFDDYDPSEETPLDGKRLHKIGRRLLKQARADSFRCMNCGREVSQLVPGSLHRNHCPYCLCSRHVDEGVGDRSSQCLSVMKPRAIVVRTTGEMAILHECSGCKKLHANRILGDDQTQVLQELGSKTVEHYRELQRCYGQYQFLSELVQLTRTL